MNATEGGPLQDLFEQALELAPENRSNFLADACGADLSLRIEIEALLQADERAAEETFWQHSALRHEALAEAAVLSEIGETIGPYRLVELIGKGGMGAVYRAERIDAAFDKSVAIKLMHGLFHSASVIAHFRAERQILANLEHPNIARLLDGGARADGLPYLVMEYVQGTSPYEFARNHNLSINDRLTLFRRICSAVHFAHQHMVIHRDLKPANILVTADGTPKLLDFGIAKVLSPDPSATGNDLTAPGMLKLTARYASPEQVRGELVTTASDLYSLGVILYELLTGHSPYGDADRPAHHMMAAVCDDEPARPSVWAPKLRGDLDNMVLRALRKPPLERYASVDQFSEDILRYLEGRPVAARGTAGLYVAAKFVRRNRVLVTAAALILCTLVVGLVEVSLARARATRRFNEVRQLAHSVMFDYADAIDGLPGATPVRARLVKDSLAYLDNLAKEADTPQLQREIVDAYVRVSNLQGNEYQNNLGDTAGSLVSAQKAVAEAEKMLRKDRSIAALDSAAAAFSTDGSVLYSSGDLHAAGLSYQRAIGLRQDIAKASPADVQNQIALATCLDHMGDLSGGYGFTSLGDTSAALAYYGQAKTLVAAMTAQFPRNVDVTKESYKTLLSLSASEGSTGRQQQAASDLALALTEIGQVSAALPNDTNVKLELAIAESQLGQLLLDARQADAAAEHFGQAYALLHLLSRPDLENAIFRRGESIVESKWGAALLIAGRPTEAVAHSRHGLQLALALSSDAPQSAQYRVDVGVSERRLSEALLASGDAPAALQRAAHAVQVLCPADSAGANANTLTNCGRALLAQANADLGLHNPLAAEHALREAIRISSAQTQADPHSAVLRSDDARARAAMAAAMAQSGDFDNARSMYQDALGEWSVLRETKSITAEDSHRSEEADLALSRIVARR